MNDTHTNDMPRNRRLIQSLAVVLAIVLVGVLGWTIASGMRGDDDPPPADARNAAQPGAAPSRDGPGGTAGAPASGAGKAALSVTVVGPQSAQWPLTLTANGSVAAWQEVVVASEISGLRLTDVLVNVGDRVRRGQVLARIASDTVQAERAQIRAGIAEAEATLAEAQANAERARLLQTTGAISTQQINQYQTAAQTAAARLEAQRARLQAEDLRLTQTSVLASDDGVISARTATPGAVVQQGAELFRLIRGGRLEWRAEVTANELGRVRPGMPARIALADGRQVNGKVRIVAPTIDPQTRNGIVYVDLPAGSELRAGMFTRGELELGQQQALTLPQSAVLLREGFSYVFRVGDDARVTQTKVETGRRVGDRVEILAGLPADARVVATGGGFLADGDLVRVVEAAPAAAAGAAAVPSGARPAAVKPAAAPDGAPAPRSTPPTR